MHFIFTWIPTMCSTLYQILWTKENKRQGSVSEGAYSAVGEMSHIQRNRVGVTQLFKFICGSSSPEVFSSIICQVLFILPTEFLLFLSSYFYPYCLYPSSFPYFLLPRILQNPSVWEWSFYTRFLLIHCISKV